MLGRNRKTKTIIKEKKRIGVLGIGSCVGTSMFAQQLAFFLSKNGHRTTFLELTENPAKGATYYSLFFDKNLEHEDIFDFYQGVRDGEKISIKHNFWREINWAITLPNSRCMSPLTELEKQHLLNNLLGEFIVCDIDFSKENSKILEEFDLLFCVVDPLPSKIMENFGTIRRVKELEFLGYDVVWIINKFNKGIHLHDLVKSLQLEEYHKIPMLSKENFYDCQYRCKSPILKSGELATFEKIFATGLAKQSIFV